MKTIKYLLAIILASVIGVSGCKKFDLKSEDLTLSADLSIIKTTVNFTFIDAATGEMIEISSSSHLKIEVITPISGLIVNTLGEYQTKYTPNYGFFSFSLNPYSTIPTADKPITILVKATLDNYLESTITIVLSEERNYYQEVNLINQPKPPVGVIIEEFEDAGKTSADGTTRDTISVNTDGGEVSVEIEAGTILKDGTGQPLSGDVSIEVMSVDVSTPEGYKNVPEINQPLITEDGSQSSLFSPIAYTRVEIKDESGRKATSITGNDMIVTTALRSDIINPNTNKPIAVGDLVPSYYFDGVDGNWKFFGKDEVSEKNGQLQLVKVIKSKKSTGDVNFSQITYSFDQETPIDIQILINLPIDKPALPTIFNTIVEGIDSEGTPAVLFSNNITLFTIGTTFTINNLSSGYASYRVKLTGAEMIDANGVSQTKTIAELEASLFRYTYDFSASQFKDPVAGDGPTRLYLQFACVPSSGNPLSMDSPDLPNSFYLIFSGTGFTGETIIQIEGGSFMLPFNPVLYTEGTWQAKVVMGSMEYPKGTGRVTAVNTDFQTIEGKVIFKYTPETAEGCDDFKKALGIN